MIDILPISTRRLAREFVQLPYTLYAADPHWVPPLKRDEYRRLSPSHNAFLSHASMDLWIARNGGRTCGRIALIEDRLFNEAQKQRTGWFGFFEAETSEIANRLLHNAEQAALARGLFLLRGPANPSLNESAGLLVHGFDEDPYVMMPYNPPAYGAFIENAGYSKVKDLLAWTIDATRPIGERIARIAARTADRRGIRVRPVDMRQFDRDLASLQAIYRTAWSDNWGFVPPTQAEIKQLASELRPILDPDIALLAEKDGRAIACAIAIPDVNQILKRMGGRLFPFGFVQLLRRRRIIDRSRVMLVGVMPEFRRLGLYPLLVAEIARRSQSRGYTRAELSWTLEDNDEINAGIQAAGGTHYKTYRVYEKDLRGERGDAERGDGERGAGERGAGERGNEDER